MYVTWRACVEEHEANKSYAWSKRNASITEQNRTELNISSSWVLEEYEWMDEFGLLFKILSSPLGEEGHVELRFQNQGGGVAVVG